MSSYNNRLNNTGKIAKKLDERRRKWSKPRSTPKGLAPAGQGPRPSKQVR